MRQPAMFPRSGLPRELEAGFARFWAAYPARTPNPRALAEKEFTRAVTAGAAVDDLVAAAGAYAAEIKRLGTANDFIVHAATFLRQQRWRDYLATAETLIVGTSSAGAEPAHELWPALKNDMDAATFNAWIGRCRYQKGGVITLFAPSAFIGKRVSDEFGALLNRRCGPVTINIPGKTTP